MTNDWKNRFDDDPEEEKAVETPQMTEEEHRELCSKTVESLDWERLNNDLDRLINDGMEEKEFEGFSDVMNNVVYNYLYNSESKDSEARIRLVSKPELEGGFERELNAFAKLYGIFMVGKDREKPSDMDKIANKKMFLYDPVTVTDPRLVQIKESDDWDGNVVFDAIREYIPKNRGNIYDSISTSVMSKLNMNVESAVGEAFKHLFLEDEDDLDRRLFIIDKDIGQELVDNMETAILKAKTADKAHKVLDSLREEAVEDYSRWLDKRIEALNDMTKTYFKDCDKMFENEKTEVEIDLGGLEKYFKQFGTENQINPMWIEAGKLTGRLDEVREAYLPIFKGYILYHLVEFQQTKEITLNPALPFMAHMLEAEDMYKRAYRPISNYLEALIKRNMGDLSVVAEVREMKETLGLD